MASVMHKSYACVLNKECVFYFAWQLCFSPAALMSLHIDSFFYVMNHKI